REYDVVPSKDTAPGFHNHHGVLDIWAYHNVPGYNVRRPANSTSVRLSVPHHQATNAVLNAWMKEQAGHKLAGALDWTTFTPREILEISERMFDVAEVPTSVRLEYYNQFTSYIYGLK
ncbi:MAG: sugar-binding protein, partial [Byssovorax sp.]